MVKKMKINDLIQTGDFKQVTDLDLEKTLEGIYCGDLLSWVMSHAKEGEAWITVQTHMNVIAVASLLNLACIIVPENIDVEAETIEKATSEEIPILVTNLNAYGIFKKLHELGM